MTLVASGAVEHTQIVAIAAEKMSGLNPGASARYGALVLCRR